MKTFLTFLFLLNGLLLSAQDKAGGRLTDENGDPLPGIRVEIREGRAATYTDETGQFRLPAAPGDTLLVYYGARPFPVVLGNDLRLDLSLDGPVAARRRLLNTGYERRPAFTTTTPVLRVDRESFNDGNIYDPLQLIQGRAPGLAIARPGGNPMEGYDFFLRGAHTLVGNPAPLIVVDGLPAASLLTLDPHDIESVTVLRSAAGAAAYGARGANGVLLIESRRGSTGKPRVRYRSYLAADGFANPTERLSASGYRSLQNDPDFPFAGQMEDLGSTTDWVEEISRSPLSQAHHLSVGGGFGQTTYRASFNYRAVNGLIRESGFDQYGGGLRLDQRLWKDRLRLSADMWLTDRQGADVLTEVYRNALNMNPTAPVRADNVPNTGEYFTPVIFDLYNPVAAIEQTTRDRDRQQWMLNLRGAFDLLPGLQLEGGYARQREDRLSGFDNPPEFFPLGANGGLATRETFASTNELGEVLLRYKASFGRNHLQLAAGHSYQQIDERSDLAWARGYFAGPVSYQDLADAGFSGAEEIDRAGLGLVRKFSAFFLRAQVDLSDFVFLNGSLRREGSSRFGDNHRWGLFPALSAGLDLSRFVAATWVGQLKVRAGYGVVGNPPPDGIYQDRRFGPTVDFYYNGEFIQGFAPYNAPNPDLRWEERRELNAGIDFSFWDERLRGSLDYYFSRSDDLVMDYEFSFPSGARESRTGNVAVMTNRGLELYLAADLVRGQKRSWTMDLNLSTFRNEAESLPVFARTGSPERFYFDFYGPGFGAGIGPRLAEGEPVSHLYYPRFRRFNNSEGWVLEDLDGDPSDFDPVVVGQARPRWTLGIGSQVRWGRFDLGMRWRGAFGHSLFFLDDLFYGWPVQNRYNLRPEAVEGDRRTFTGPPQQSDFFVKKGNFLRLDNLVIGCRLGGVRLFAAGNNLLTLTSYEGMDPEPRYARTLIYRPGPGFQELNTEVDNFDLQAPHLAGGHDDARTYPLNRSLVLGVDIEL